MDSFVRHESEVPGLKLPGRMRKILWDTSNGTRRMTCGIAEFPPLTRAPGHTHTGQEELIYILAGEGAFIFDDRTEPVRTGSCVLVPADTFHQVETTGPEPLKVLFVFAPPGVPE